MGLKVTGAENVEQTFSSLDRNTKRRLRRAMVRTGRRLQTLAQKMAPRDEANLEQAIKLRGDTGSEQVRDTLGRMQRIDVEVYVDMSVPVPDRPGKTVGDYAYEMHEHLEPVGPLQLGEGSRNKQAGQPEIVGGGYMERAAIEIEKELDREFLAVLSDMDLL